MLLLIVILLLAFVVVPLIDLTLKEQVQFIVKVLAYLLALVFVLYTLVMLKGGL